MTRFVAGAALFVIAVTLVLGCINSRTLPPQAKLGEPFWIPVGRATQIDGLKLKFVRVVEDSRCPSDVVCVWEGNAKVELAVRTTVAMKEILTLNSSLEPVALDYAGYRLGYLDLQPRPCTRCRLNPYAYRLKLVVTRSTNP